MIGESSPFAEEKSKRIIKVAYRITFIEHSIDYLIDADPFRMHQRDLSCQHLTGYRDEYISHDFNPMAVTTDR